MDRKLLNKYTDKYLSEIIQLANITSQAELMSETLRIIQDVIKEVYEEGFAKGVERGVDNWIHKNQN